MLNGGGTVCKLIFFIADASPDQIHFLSTDTEQGIHYKWTDIGPAEELDCEVYMNSVYCMQLRPDQIAFVYNSMNQIDLFDCLVLDSASTELLDS